jgi:hypothetical protein
VIGLDSSLYERCTFEAGGSIAHIRKDIRDTAAIVAHVVPCRRLEIAPDTSPDTRSYRVNSDKIARVLPAFKPQWDARRRAEQLYNAYRQSKLTLEKFEWPRYQRIAHIQKLATDGILADDFRHRRAAEQTATLPSSRARPEANDDLHRNKA